jgi:hypothetical protein
VTFKSLRRNFTPVGEQFGSYFAFAIVVERISESRLGAAEATAGLVEDDADEPGTEAGLGTEATEIAVGLEKGLLCGVFCLGFVVQEGESHEVDAALVGTDEFMEEFVVSGKDSRDHRGLFLLTSR